VISTDGTTIGYRQLGKGPGLILLHGAGQTSQNLLMLAKILSDQFTLYVPDRRGRGASGPFAEGHGIDKEVEDLAALLDETGAHDVFGLSAGAVIALWAARTLGSIRRLALYEPPLSFDGVSQTAWVPRYERELARGDPASAFVTVMRGTADRTGRRLVPRALLVRRIAKMIQATDAKQLPPGVVRPRDLIATVHFDVLAVMQAAGSLQRYGGLSCEVLLLDGEKSARSLRAAVDGLSVVLPNARRVTLRGVGHTAADNTGEPRLVAAELRRFFGDAPRN
jgi:pimeloyl-ACP methyl ester carboxylesterase